MSMALNPRLSLGSGGRIETFTCFASRQQRVFVYESAARRVASTVPRRNGAKRKKGVTYLGAPPVFLKNGNGSKCRVEQQNNFTVIQQTASTL